MFLFDYLVITSILSQLENLLNSIAGSPYIDMIKMFVGCTAWIGGLVLFIRWKDKRKQKTHYIAWYYSKKFRKA